MGLEFKINLGYILKDEKRDLIILDREYRDKEIFNTPIEAFNWYKIEKEKYIKKVAEKYKNSIPEKLYNALYKYEVEITD